MEVHLRLGIDPRHADQLVRGTVVLPHGTGRTTRVIVFAQGEKAQDALRGGADEVGGDDLVKKIDDGWFEFDVAIATPDMMGTVGRLGKKLGPRGLMPNPKSGTVTFDIERAVGEIKSGRIEFKVDRAGIVHAPVGSASFTRSSCGQHRHPCGRGPAGQADRRQGHLHAHADPCPYHGSRLPHRHPFGAGGGQRLIICRGRRMTHRPAELKPRQTALCAGCKPRTNCRPDESRRHAEAMRCR